MAPDRTLAAVARRLESAIAAMSIASRLAAGGERGATLPPVARAPSVSPGRRPPPHPEAGPAPGAAYTAAFRTDDTVARAVERALVAMAAARDAAIRDSAPPAPAPRGRTTKIHVRHLAASRTLAGPRSDDA